MSRYTIAPVRFGTVEWAAARPLDMPSLTRVQTEIVKFIHRYQSRWGSTPLYSEIGRACRLASDSAVAYQIARLVGLGVLHKPPRRHRAIVLKIVPVGPT